MGFYRSFNHMVVFQVLIGLKKSNVFPIIFTKKEWTHLFTRQKLSLSAVSIWLDLYKKYTHLIDFRCWILDLVQFVFGEIQGDYSGCSQILTPGVSSIFHYCWEFDLFLFVHIIVLDYRHFFHAEIHQEIVMRHHTATALSLAVEWTF